MPNDDPSFALDVRLTLDVPETAEPGTTIPITLRVENLRDHTIELTLRGREIAFDVIVRDNPGRVIWQRLAGAVIPSIVRLEPVPAHGVLELRTEWRASAQTGDFSVEATLFTDGPELCPPPVRLSLRR